MTCRQCGGDLLPGLGLCLKCATPTDARAGSGELEVSLGPVGAPARNSALTLLGAVVGPLDIADHERALLIAGPDDASLDLLGRWLTTRGAAVRLRPPGESPRWHVGFEPTPLAPGLVLVPVLTAAVVTFAAASTTVAWAGVAVTALLLLHVFGPRPASRRLAVGTIPGLETIDAPLAEHLRLVRASLTDPEAIEALAQNAKATHVLLDVIRFDGEHLSSEPMKANDQFLAVALREATRLAADADRQRKLQATGVASTAASNAERRRQAALRTLGQLTTHLAQTHTRLQGLSRKDAVTSLLASLGEHRGLIVRSRQEAGESS